MYVYIFFLFFGVGGKCGGGGQNDRGEILLSAPPLLACVFTVATALRRIRSAVGERHASPHRHLLVHNERVDGAANIALDSHFARPWLQKAAGPPLRTFFFFSPPPPDVELVCAQLSVWMTSIRFFFLFVWLFNIIFSFCVNGH